MNIRLLKLLTTLAILGACVSGSAFAGKTKDCLGDDPHPSCGGGDGDGGGGGGGGPSGEYTVALTMGGFTFEAVDLTLNNRGNGYNSVMSQLLLDRPDELAEPVETDQWDEVFRACDEVFDVDDEGWPIQGVEVSPGWGITQGGRKQSDLATNIRIAFRDIVAAGFEEVKSGFVLYTLDSFPRDAFVPLEGHKSVYPLTHAYIQADDIANHRVCRPTTVTLGGGGAILEICHKDEDGDCY